jgi:hypothetical protein
MSALSHQAISARVVAGYRVASGLNGNPRFPGGTLRMQAPHFRDRGFDISHLYPGTLNVSIAPHSYRVVKARHTFAQVKWHPSEPAEDFSFFDVRATCPNDCSVFGFVYFPHPETKPEHFQQPDVLELLLPFLEGLRYGMVLTLEIPTAQMVFESSTRPANFSHLSRE